MGERMNQRNGHGQAGRRRLAFFGGTFDPPHVGHLAIVRAVLEGGYADGVLVAPALRPPHKSRVPTTPFPHRLAMLRLAFAGIAGTEVSEIENIADELPSYTFETLARVEARCPGDDVVLLIGSDSLRQLHTWHRAADLVSRWPLLVYPRPGEPVALAELRRHWPEETARRLLAAVLPMVEHDLSATVIRDRLAQHEIGRDPGLADLLPPGVGEYIHRHGLYCVGVSVGDNSTRTPHFFDKEHTMAEPKSPRISAADLATACMEIATDRKAGNVIKIDVGELSLIAEYFVLCTAGSEPHLKGLESYLGRELLKRYKIRPRAVDGSPASQWIVMDFSGVVVHLLTEETRELYQLENLWQNAPTLAELENLAERMPESTARRKK
jgi:nicotinate-nucleotide adenylyltransferase